MTQYDFDRSKHFFDEMLVLIGTVLGLHGLIRHDQAMQQIHAALDWSQLPRPRPNLRLKNVPILNLHEGPGRVVTGTLINGEEIVRSLLRGEEPELIKYVDEGLVLTGEETEGQLLEYKLPPRHLSLTAQIAINSAFENISDCVVSTWGTNPLSWPPILQYFRHVRNAASHGNRFDIRGHRGNPGIDSANPPKWRTSIMPDDSTMNRMSLFGDWWDVGDTPIFFGDVEILLRSGGIAVPVEN